jgi:hypothetical protein
MRYESMADMALRGSGGGGDSYSRGYSGGGGARHCAWGSASQAGATSAGRLPQP